MHRVLVTGKLDPVALDILRREPDIHVDDRPDLPLPQIADLIAEYHCLVSRSETKVRAAERFQYATSVSRMRSSAAARKANRLRNAPCFAAMRELRFTARPAPANRGCV